MGYDKALLEIPGGGWFLGRLGTTLFAGGCDRVVAVVGPAAAARIAGAIERDRLPIELVLNVAPSRGQLSSLQAALRYLAGDSPRAAVVSLVDQPLVRDDTVRKLIAGWTRTAAPVVRPARGERHGHPVLFDGRVLPQLLAGDPLTGVRPVVRAHARDALNIQVDDPGAFEDIDTPEDYERVFGRKIEERR